MIIEHFEYVAAWSFLYFHSESNALLQRSFILIKLNGDRSKFNVKYLNDAYFVRLDHQSSEFGGYVEGSFLRNFK